MYGTQLPNISGNKLHIITGIIAALMRLILTFYCTSTASIYGGQHKE